MEITLAQDNWMGRDKALHVVVGFFIYIFLFLAFKYALDFSSLASILIVFIVCEVINVGKELTDKTGFSYKDICAGTLGNLIGLIIMSLWLL